MKKVFTLLTLLLLPLALAAAPAFEEEIHYSSVVPEQPGAAGGKVQVMEFFWYGCGHCYDLEPHLKKWLQRKPGYVEFVKIPAMWNRPDVTLHAKTFYALELMGAPHSIHDKIFHAMHEEKQLLKTQEEMEAFLAKQGIDLDEFRKAMGSFAVQSNTRRAAVLAKRFDVRAVPSVGVDGKYLISGQGAANTIQVMDYLIAKEREKKTAQAKK